MNIDKLDKHIHLTEFGNGAVDVTIFGQSAFTITKSNSCSIGEEHPKDCYYWTLNPVFARLTYGANLYDIPYCTKPLDTVEDAIADGVSSINKLGAFTSMVDLPDDTNTVKYDDSEIEKAKFDAEAELRAMSMGGRGVFESVSYLKKLKSKNLIPAFTVEHLMEKFVQGQEFTKAERVAAIEHSYVSQKCLNEQGICIVSEMKFKEVDVIVASVVEEVNEDNQIDTRSTFEKYKSLNEERENKRKIITHSSGDKESHVYRLPDTDEYKVEFAKGGVRNKDADYYTNDKEDAHSTAKSWLKQTNEDLERNRSEFTANTQLSSQTDKPADTPKKKIRIVGPTGGTVSKHDSEAEARAHFRTKGYSKNYTIESEDESGAITDITQMILESLTESDEAYQKWVDDVQAKHGEKKLKFKGRVEQGTHTTSAEESGKDRSYGVWDHDQCKGHVFENSIDSIGEITERDLTSSEREKQETIVTTLKKRPGFVSKYGKDAIYAVAATLAKTSGG